MEQQASDKIISIQELQGVNERAKFGAGKLGEFDRVLGLFTPSAELLQEVPGKLFLQHFPAGVREIHQTNDSRQNIIIQGQDNVYVMSEADFFNRPLVTNLTPVPTTEEEDMSQALIGQIVAGVNTGAGASTNGVFVTRTLTNIVSQFNADGTAAAFASLAGNVITLTAGWYRIRGWCYFAGSAAGQKCLSRLFNTGTAAPLWAGLLNENSEQIECSVAGKNTKMEVSGVYHANGGPVSFRFETKALAAVAGTVGLGQPEAAVGSNDIYTWLDILRTGA